MNNDFCHLELNTDNPSSAKEFYGALFSWKLEDMPLGPATYTMVTTGTGPGGGIQKKPMPEAPTMWLPYIQVVSIEETCAQAQKLGGKLVVPKTPIPNMGAFAILQDPGGAAFGIWSK